MIDAMDRFRMLQKMAAPKAAAPQPASQAQFGQKVTVMHPQPKHGGDVFVKSIKPTDAAAKPVAPQKSANPMGSALQNFVKKVNGSENPLFGALKKLTPASQAAKPESTRNPAEALKSQPVMESPFLKAGEKNLSAPGRAAATPLTSAQLNQKKVTLFAGAAVTSVGLGALTAAVAGPAALAANPGLLNKIVSLLPTQLP